MGFEPTTASLEGWNSTTELRPPFLTFLAHTLIKPQTLRCTRLAHSQVRRTSEAWFGGQARIRTLEDISQQIYSLPPLATWVPARDVSLFYTNQIAAQARGRLTKTSRPTRAQLSSSILKD